MMRVCKGVRLRTYMAGERHLGGGEWCFVGRIGVGVDMGYEDYFPKVVVSVNVNLTSAGALICEQQKGSQELSGNFDVCEDIPKHQDLGRTGQQSIYIVNDMAFS
jgi:hypothetical protein